MTLHRHPVRKFPMVLLTGAALLLAPAVVAVPASADDSHVIDVPGQPLGVAAELDGTMYVSDYNWAGGISVFKTGEARASRHIKVGHFPTSVAMAPDGTLFVVQTRRTCKPRLASLLLGPGKCPPPFL